MGAKHQAIAGPCAWLGKDIANSKRWIRTLDAAGIAALDTSLAGVRHLPWHEVTRDRFPLPALAPLLADIREELENGCGMMKLRGLPVERYSAGDLRRIWYGIGSNLG